MNNTRSGIIPKTQSKRYKGYWLVKIVDYFPVLGFLFILLVFGLTTGGKMFTLYNMKTIFTQSFTYIIGGLGVIFCYAQGIHDFSLAANIGLSSIIATRFGGNSPILTVLLALGTSMTIGAINGILYAKTGLGDFILTLSMNFMISGTLTVLMNKEAFYYAPEALRALKSTSNEIIFLTITTVIVVYVFEFTKYGRHCKTLSAGGAAAEQCGINVNRMKFTAFLIAGFTAGVVACLSLIRTGTSSTGSGAMFHFNIMICMILGGMPLKGGKDASVLNVFFGTFACMTLMNGMVMWNLNSRVQDIVKGVVFITVAVGLERLREKAEKV